MKASEEPPKRIKDGLKQVSFEQLVDFVKGVHGTKVGCVMEKQEEDIPEYENAQKYALRLILEKIEKQWTPKRILANKNVLPGELMNITSSREGLATSLLVEPARIGAIENEEGRHEIFFILGTKRYTMKENGKVHIDEIHR